MKFRRDVESTKGLKGKFCKGLQALRPVDRRRLAVENRSRLVGSADIDSALISHFPDAPRWDYVVGYKKNVPEVMLYWIEVHPADGNRTITEINNKFDWLLGWVAGTRLHRYPKRYCWVSSGKCSFTARDPKIKALAQRGLDFRGEYLRIGHED